MYNPGITLAVTDQEVVVAGYRHALGGGGMHLQDAQQLSRRGEFQDVTPGNVGDVDIVPGICGDPLQDHIGQPFVENNDTLPITEFVYQIGISFGEEEFTSFIH